MFLGKPSNRTVLRHFTPTLNLTIRLPQLTKRRVNRPLSRPSTTMDVVPNFRYTLNANAPRRLPRTLSLYELRKGVRRGFPVATCVTTYETSGTVRAMNGRQLHRTRITPNTRGRLITVNPNLPSNLRNANQGNRLAKQRRDAIGVRGGRFLLRDSLALSLPIRNGTASRRARNRSHRRRRRGNTINLFLLLSNPNATIPTTTLLPILKSTTKTTTTHILLYTTTKDATKDPLFFPTHDILTKLYHTKYFLFQNHQHGKLFNPTTTRVVLDRPMVLTRLANTRKHTYVTFFRYFRNLIRRSHHLHDHHTIEDVNHFVTNNTRHITNPTNDDKILHVTRRVRQTNDVLFEIRRRPRARNNVRLLPTISTHRVKRAIVVFKTLLLTNTSIVRRNSRTILPKLILPIPTR